MTDSRRFADRQLSRETPPFALACSAPHIHSPRLAGSELSRLECQETDAAGQSKICRFRRVDLLEGRPTSQTENHCWKHGCPWEKPSPPARAGTRRLSYALPPLAPAEFLREAAPGGRQHVPAADHYTVGRSAGRNDKFGLSWDRLRRAHPTTARARIQAAVTRRRWCLPTAHCPEVLPAVTRFLPVSP